MLVPDRRRLLLAELGRRGSAQIEDLADVLAVSASTVRRDLALLEADGHLRRAHGGAYLPQPGARRAAGGAGGPAGTDTAVGDAKVRIGAAAATRILDGTTVMILAGSTTATMLAHLGEHEITVVTNGLDVARELAPFAGVEVVVLGGILDRRQMSLLGQMTMQNMADLHVDTMFAGAWGVSDAGVTSDKVMLAGYHHEMLRHADSLVVLADGAKFGRTGPSLLAELTDVEAFVTDTAAPDAIVAGLRERGATVVVC